MEKVRTRSENGNTFVMSLPETAKKTHSLYEMQQMLKPYGVVELPDYELVTFRYIGVSCRITVPRTLPFDEWGKSVDPFKLYALPQAEESWMLRESNLGLTNIQSALWCVLDEEVPEGDEVNLTLCEPRAATHLLIEFYEGNLKVSRLDSSDTGKLPQGMTIYSNSAYRQNTLLFPIGFIRRYPSHKEESSAEDFAPALNEADLQFFAERSQEWREQEQMKFQERILDYARRGEKVQLAIKGRENLQQELSDLYRDYNELMNLVEAYGLNIVHVIGQEPPTVFEGEKLASVGFVDEVSSKNGLAFQALDWRFPYTPEGVQSCSDFLAACYRRAIGLSNLQDETYRNCVRALECYYHVPYYNPNTLDGSAAPKTQIGLYVVFGRSDGALYHRSYSERHDKGTVYLRFDLDKLGYEQLCSEIEACFQRHPLKLYFEQAANRVRNIMS